MKPMFEIALHKRAETAFLIAIDNTCLRSHPKVCFEMVVTLFYQNMVYLDVKGRTADGGMVFNNINIQRTVYF
jgi:hypothetical protein